ncbi:MAG: ribosomal RNA small subunit methyltransferase A, partial [Thioalkalivibrionaceae bacterium]
MIDLEQRSTPHRPRKRFGQHFLHDKGVLDRIVRAIHPQRGDALVEIGPGEGALTNVLLREWLSFEVDQPRPLPAMVIAPAPSVSHDNASATIDNPATSARSSAVLSNDPKLSDQVVLHDRLDIIEIDRDLVARLRQHPAATTDHMRVHECDALDFDFEALAARRGKRLRVVGNLPYNISTPLIAHLLDQSSAWTDAHFLLQREVVDRLTATPGGGHYGRLAVLVALHGKATRLFDIGPSAFRPPPKVESAVVRIQLDDQPKLAASQRERLLDIAKDAFGQRRKTISR